MLVLLLALAWVTRDQWGVWLPSVRSLLPSRLPHFGAADTTTDRTIAWRPVTAGGASHAERIILGMGGRSSAAFVTVLPADFAAFMLADLAGHVPPAADSTDAAIVDHRLALRTWLDIKALGGRTALGPLVGVLADREPLTLAGTFDVVRPGVAEFHVQHLTVHGLAVPAPMIPQLVRKVEAGPHPAGLAPDALLLNVPPFVADIRVLGDKLALYRNVP
jgi:hypothetical protein